MRQRFRGGRLGNYSNLLAVAAAAGGAPQRNTWRLASALFGGPEAERVMAAVNQDEKCGIYRIDPPLSVRRLVPLILLAAIRTGRRPRFRRYRRLAGGGGHDIGVHRRGGVQGKSGDQDNADYHDADRQPTTEVVREKFARYTGYRTQGANAGLEQKGWFHDAPRCAEAYFQSKP